MINRRQWFYRVGLIASAAAQSGSASLAAAEGVAKTERKPLDLSEYEPKSMLHVRESHVERARFAVIDFHTHISFSAKSAKGVELAPDTSGTLVKIDDPRFDPMWDTCGELHIPVAIHVSDPVAFFTPTDRFNERYEELNNHPDWSFYGGDFPSNAELLEARNRVIAGHPKTQFVVLHVGNYSENLENVSMNLDRFPNMSVDIAARIGELGRQPRTAAKFFDKYQDRILFATDATPHGDEFPQQVFNDKLYEIYYRFLETDDEYFDYAPAKIPPQGRWRIYGINLPEPILRKVYYENAARHLRIAT